MAVLAAAIDRIRRMLGSNEVDADALVELTTVNAYEAPVLCQVLASNGLACQQEELYDAFLGLAKVQVLVAERDRPQAEAVLADFRRP